MEAMKDAIALNLSSKVLPVHIGNVNVGGHYTSLLGCQVESTSGACTGIPEFNAFLSDPLHRLNC